MAWDPVPWLIGGDEDGGAKHSPEIMRMLAYYLMGGQQGVLSSLDLRVLADDTPGPRYKVMPGSSSVLSAWQPLQAYINRMPTATVRPGGPRTSTASSRSDLVVVNIQDPFSPGSPWDPPADRLNGPYIDSTLITDVPPGTREFSELGITSWSAYELCRIDMPPDTETLTQPMFHDLRTVVNPLTGIGSDNPTPSKASPWFTESSRTVSGSVKAWSDGSYTNWPAEANWQVPVPPWATGADVFVQLNPHINGNVWGNIRLNIGGSIGNPSYYDADTTGYERAIIWTSGTQPIPAGVRGTVANVQVEVASLMSADQSPGDLIADEHSYVYVSLHFKQEPLYL